MLFENGKSKVFEILELYHIFVVEGIEEMVLVARKPVFGVSDKARRKPVSLATETS